MCKEKIELIVYAVFPGLLVDILAECWLIFGDDLHSFFNHPFFDSPVVLIREEKHHALVPWRGGRLLCPSSWGFLPTPSLDMYGKGLPAGGFSSFGARGLELSIKSHVFPVTLLPTPEGPLHSTHKFWLTTCQTPESLGLLSIPRPKSWIIAGQLFVSVFVKCAQSRANYKLLLVLLFSFYVFCLDVFRSLSEIAL